MKKYLITGKNYLNGSKKLTLVAHHETDDKEDAVNKEIKYMRFYDHVQSYENKQFIDCKIFNQWYSKINNNKWRIV